MRSRTTSGTDSSGASSPLDKWDAEWTTSAVIEQAGVLTAHERLRVSSANAQKQQKECLKAHKRQKKLLNELAQNLDSYVVQLIKDLSLTKRDMPKKIKRKRGPELEEAMEESRAALIDRRTTIGWHARVPPSKRQLIRDSMYKRKQVSDEEFAERRRKVIEAKDKLKELSIALPMDIGIALRLLLGDVNLTLPDMSDRFKYKQAYEKFKLNNTWAIIAGALVAMYMNVRIIDSLYYIFLGWFYASVTIRELILRANGSSIRTWWLAHHYGNIILAAVLLLWPPSKGYDEFRIVYRVFSLYAGTVQVLQYRYQAAALYKKRALGQSRLLDTTTDLPNKGTFWLLIVFLILAYLFQLYNALVLFTIGYRVDTKLWQPWVGGVLFTLMGLGNILITSQVVFRKYVPSKFSARGVGRLLAEARQRDTHSQQ